MQILSNLNDHSFTKCKLKYTYGIYIFSAHTCINLPIILKNFTRVFSIAYNSVYYRFDIFPFYLKKF